MGLFDKALSKIPSGRMPKIPENASREQIIAGAIKLRDNYLAHKQGAKEAGGKEMPSTTGRQTYHYGAFGEMTHKATQNRSPGAIASQRRKDAARKKV